MLAQLETKKRELNEETRERKEQFELWVKKLCKILEIDQEKFIKEQLEWAETEERGSPNDDPVSVEESRHCECTTCTMNLVWIKIGGAEMNSVRSSLDGAAEKIASEYVCEKNQEGLEQLQQILLSKIEMANERGEKMIEALKKDKEERNVRKFNFIIV
ncbi:hypothetical protein B9Z55_016792 [Caenorhabditis nigoni]|uniref:Uncharacterized protein n=1 Tax=Caenorhabditis nigoni TaxID=1611254 RepID=A0A2G5T6N4_9PELO|nr:hypothetical protein B9Z55_016792 [Caenorhabditis nigoni]